MASNNNRYQTENYRYPFTATKTTDIKLKYLVIRETNTIWARTTSHKKLVLSNDNDIRPSN